MSCNAYRVHRKGCSDDCTIRPCLQWIKSPKYQANATLFLTNFICFYFALGTATIFRSLLYEACGRVANPVSGSVGLLWSGNWAVCQAAVEAVFGRSSIMQVPSSCSETEEGKGLELISFFF
ncbi:hypothetical protein K2173_000215 [Erythroxylum novogranatense]|uniref:LOB domain-containing protein n=1 Tax=Erythroxylum novogranatense TaxID=1862640 RepID=A0AAV8SWJ6_9ROSI|nr:hypothetical protein K2173_000215 [Erythroxylum novogranatense]